MPILPGQSPFFGCTAGVLLYDNSCNDWPSEHAPREAAAGCQIDLQDHDLNSVLINLVEAVAGLIIL